MAKKRLPAEYADVHTSADYFEPLFRARFVRAMKLLRKQTSINDLAMSMGNHKQAADVVPTQKIADALQPLAKIVRDAYRQGGKHGASRVRGLV